MPYVNTASCSQHMSGARNLQQLFDDLFGIDDEADESIDSVHRHGLSPARDCLPNCGMPLSGLATVQPAQLQAPPGLIFIKSLLNQQQQVVVLLCYPGEVACVIINLNL